MAYFIYYSRNTDASHRAKLFFKEIIKLHDLPITIMSDGDVKFINYF